MRSSPLQRGKRYVSLWQLFVRIFYLFDSIFQRYFGSISCIIFMKEFISHTMVATERGKRQFLSYYSNGCYEEEKLYQELESYRFKLPLQKLD